MHERILRYINEAIVFPGVYGGINGKTDEVMFTDWLLFEWKSSVLRTVSILWSNLEMLNIDWLYWIIENTMKKNTTFQWYIMSSQKVVDLHICLPASSSWFFEYVVMALEQITKCIQPSNPYQWIIILLSTKCMHYFVCICYKIGLALPSIIIANSFIR